MACRPSTALCQILRPAGFSFPASCVCFQYRWSPNCGIYPPFDDPPQSGYHGEKAPQGQEPPAPPREGDTSDGASAVFGDAEAEDKRGYSGGEYTANSPTEYPNVSYPGDDPHTPPGKGWEWRGPADKGSYYNPKTGESMRPDLDHGQPIGPHWDYKAPDGKWYRLYPDGSIVPKK